MKFIRYMGTALATLLPVMSCEKDNLAPIAFEMKLSKVNLPASTIKGMPVAAACTGLQASDTANIYLRPAAGGEDLRVNWGDMTKDPQEGGSGSIRDNWGLEEEQRGQRPFTGWELLITPPKDIADGEYLVVLKRDGQDIIFERTNKPVFGAHDDYDREPIATNSIRIGHIELASQAKAFAIGQEIVVIGNEIDARDQLSLTPIGKNPDPTIYYLIPNEIRHNLSFRAIVPEKQNEETPIALDTTYILSYHRRGYSMPIGRIRIKAPLAITDVVLPETAIKAGQEARIKCNGGLATDKVILAGSDFKERVVDDAEVSATEVKFTMPEGLPDGPVLVQLFRDEKNPYFQLGYLSQKEAIELTEVPESGYGSIPSRLPEGYPFTLEGEVHSLTLKILGNGFSAPDKIRFAGTDYPIAVEGNRCTVTLNTQNVSGRQRLELVRGRNVRFLKEVEVVAAPKLGDYAEGGVVYWIDPTDPTHGLVSSVTDLVDSEGKNLMKWGTTGILAATDESIRASMKNTEAMVKAFGERHICASLCYNYEVTVAGKTYDDWALPSLDALRELSKQMPLINKAGKSHGGKPLQLKKKANQADIFYLSSTQQRAAISCTAVSMPFGGKTGKQTEIVYLLDNVAVRAVRAF